MSADAPPEPLVSARLTGMLRQRQISMLAIGGVIGSGLFVGSGTVITLAGPGVLLCFVFAGALTLVVMRMMAEMGAAFPSSGSFSEHAERAFGPWAGLLIGWLYWITLVVVLAIEATAAAIIVRGWLPGVPQWSLVLVFMTVFTAVNLAAVSKFGEFEFWFALLKVAAIVGFLVVGVLAIFGMLPGTTAVGLTNLDGFLPNGWSGVLAGLVTALSAFGGLEVVTIAAAESANPPRAIARAVHSAVWRICLFYIGSMLVVVTLLPWDDSGIGRSPFVAALEHIGVPAASQIMSVVVLVALLSALNANTYAAARMIFSLAARRQAPTAVTRLTRNGVPSVAVVASAGFGFAAVVLNVLWPDTIFLFLLNAAGTALLFVWILVACSQLRLRRTIDEAGMNTVRMWGHPYLTWIALAAMVGLLLSMFTGTDTRPQVISCTIVCLSLLSVGLLRRRRGATTPSDSLGS
jgi:aromatic amino acid permease